MDKKKRSVSQTLVSFRGWIQAAATLCTNNRILNFGNGSIYQGTAKTMCVPGLNCYSCPGAAGACPIGSFQAVVGSSKFRFSYYITGILILLGVLLGRIVPVLGHLAFSLAEYKKGMERFALMLDAEGSDRTPDGLAELFGRCFPAEFRLNEASPWMALTNETSQYLSVLHTGEDKAKLVKRIHYVTFVGMLRADFFDDPVVKSAEAVWIPRLSRARRREQIRIRRMSFMFL